MHTKIQDLPTRPVCGIRRVFATTRTSGFTLPSRAHLQDDARSKQTPSNYVLISIRITARAIGGGRATWATRLTLTDPLRPTWSPRVARRAARVAPSRSESLDRGASSDKSRPKRLPERPRDAIFDDFGSIFEPIFGFSLGCSRERPTLQKPWFFTSKPLQDAIFACPRFLQESHENLPKISSTTLCKRPARKNSMFSAPGRHLASILVALARSRALLGAPFDVPGRLWGLPWALPGHAGDYPRRV